MPDRILRDLTDSEAFNAVSWHAQSLYIRILNKVDDYGCYIADVKRLRPFLYPLLLDKVRETDLSRWIDELASRQSDDTPGLIRLYAVDGRRFLEVSKWAKQRLRAKKRKYPAPPWVKEPKAGDAEDGGMADMRPADDGHPPSDADSDADSETPLSPPHEGGGKKRRRRANEDPEDFASRLARQEAASV